MQALLIKNEAWAYVSGQKPKPEASAQNAEEIRKWENEDKTAKSDIIWYYLSDIIYKTVAVKTNKGM